jgi:hypothetical protein
VSDSDRSGIVNDPIPPGMQRVRWHMTIGFANADREGYFYIEVDATEDEIQARGREEAFDYLELAIWKDSES